VLTGALCVVVAMLVRADAPRQQSAPPPASPSAATARAQATENRNAPELAEFKKRVDEYSAVARKHESALPKLSKEATPEEIDRNQRALAKLIASSRPKAKQGDVFAPRARAYIRALLKRLFMNMDRARLRETIQDENPGPVQMQVNGRYPDSVPVTTMPPEVLAALPMLPEELEYRFLGSSLILLDTRARLVIDFLPNALPQ
jgi:hypothetical protein